MKKIRIGKDILFKWAITTNGEPVSLDGRDLRLELKSPFGTKSIINFDTDDNVVIFKFLGINQKNIGIYGLTLWENYGKEGQTAVDLSNAFELVYSTEKEN